MTDPGWAGIPGNSCFPVSSRCMVLPGEVRTEHDPVLQHGAGDGEQPVGHGPQGEGMVLAAGTERRAVRLADGIVPDGDGGSMVHGAPQPVVGGEVPRTVA